MKEVKFVIKEFCELFANCLCAVVLLVGGFNILINLYHYNEVTYKYQYNITEDEDYVKTKAKIAKLKEKTEKSMNNVINLSEKTILDVFRLNLKDCLEDVEKSGFFNIEKTTFDYKDIYDYNNELYSNLQTKCLFQPIYTITSGNNNNKLGFNYVEKIESDKDILSNYESYLKEQILGNSNYYYFSDISRLTLYNQTQHYFQLNYHNYSLFMEDIELMVNWYEEKVGR